MGLFCAGQLGQLTYHLWGEKKEKLGIMSCAIHVESPCLKKFILYLFINPQILSSKLVVDFMATNCNKNLLLTFILHHRIRQRAVI